ncbi:hypothetical protein CR513_55332, partial [Mucuna pruriens]
MAIVDLITYIEGYDNPRPKSFIVHYNSASQTRALLIYNNNAVLWRYPIGERATPLATIENSAPEVTNIARTGGVTRSGRVFTLENL